MINTILPYYASKIQCTQATTSFKCSLTVNTRDLSLPEVTTNIIVIFKHPRSILANTGVSTDIYYGVSVKPFLLKKCEWKVAQSNE